MPNPKNRNSKQRKHKRRTHLKAEVPQIATCPTTGEKHVYHHTYYDAEGNMFYRGKMVIKVDEDEG